MLVGLALGGCVGTGFPSHSPDEPGIPEARAAAVAQLQRIESQLTFTDRVEVLADGTADDCGSVHNWWFDNTDPGYRCWMAWTAVAIVHDVGTREQLIAAIESEIAGFDLPFAPGGMLRDYIELYPNQRDTMPLTTGGSDGGFDIRVTTEPYRADTWRSPLHPGDLDPDAGTAQPSRDRLAAGGAGEVLTIRVDTEYWSTEPTPDAPPQDDPNQEGVPEGAHLKYWSYADRYGFDLAALEPALPESCLGDPAIDPATIARYDEPFARLSFSLRADAASGDSQRIRDCIVPNLSPGTTIVVYQPFVEPGDS